MILTDEFLRLREALEVAEQIATAFTARRKTTHLNSVEYTGRAPLSAVPTTDLTFLIDRGHLVDVRVRADLWRLHLRRGGTDGDVTESDGPIAEAVDQSRIDLLQDAIEAKDFNNIIALLQGHDADVTLRVVNVPDQTGTHWIATHSAIVDSVVSSMWVPFASQLTSGPTQLLVDDLDDLLLTAEALTVQGPRAAEAGLEPPDRESRATVAAADEGFRTSRAHGGTPYPSPLPLMGLRKVSGEQTAAALETLSAFEHLVYLLTWALLATSSLPIEGGVQVKVSGARELEIEVRPVAETETHELEEMYRWVALSPEIDRLYFAQQALTLAIVSASDVHGAAEPALRTAKSLYDLSRRNSVAEVMSARRSAREIALSASRSAASQARESAAKAVERTVIQVAAAAGIILAQAKQALDAEQAAWLLALVVVLCVASAVVTDRVMLVSARNGLTKELQDLDRFRDSLSEEDVKNIQAVGAVTAARSDLVRAQWTNWLTYGLAAVVFGSLAICFGVSAGSTHRDDPRTPMPSNSQTSSAPADSASSQPTQSPQPGNQTTPQQR